MVRAVSLAALAVAVLAGTASAQQFNGGIPAGWTCTGDCGTSGANGDVPLAPSGGTQYGWVSTRNGVQGVNLPNVGGEGQPTNGSRLRSVMFNANAGEILSFRFNYITSDGAGYADYAWARLLDASLNPVATIFTARTTEVPGGNTVPGFGMPPLPPGVTLNPGTVMITPGATNFAPLGEYSGDCFDVGCGNTGWVFSQYTVGSSGQFVIEFGVTNWNDENYDSALAFDGLAIGGVIIGPPPPTSTVPEPTTVALVGTGLLGLGLAARRRRAA